MRTSPDISVVFASFFRCAILNPASCMSSSRRVQQRGGLCCRLEVLQILRIDAHMPCYQHRPAPNNRFGFKCQPNMTRAIDRLARNFEAVMIEPQRSPLKCGSCKQGIAADAASSAPPGEAVGVIAAALQASVLGY